MLTALAEAGPALRRPDYVQTARRNAHFLLTDMRQPDGRLSHSRLEGPARSQAFLEDQAFVMEGLLALYQVDFDERWFAAAAQLAECMLSHYAAPQGGFFDTPHDHEPLISRPRELQDNAVPCGNSVAATALLRLAALTGEGKYRTAAEETLATVGGLPAHYPAAFARWLTAMTLAAEPGMEVAVVGSAGEADTEALLHVVRTGFHPQAVLAFREPGHDTRIPLLKAREPAPPHYAATAWLCRGLACASPTTEASGLETMLRGEGTSTR